MPKWIEFKEVRDTGKTKVFEVIAVEDGFKLGEMKWFGRWRKYSFFPSSETVFEKDCLQDIADFLDGLMEARKKVRNGQA